MFSHNTVTPLLLYRLKQFDQCFQACQFIHIQRIRTRHTFQFCFDYIHSFLNIHQHFSVCHNLQFLLQTALDHVILLFLTAHQYSLFQFRPFFRRHSEIYNNISFPVMFVFLFLWFCFCSWSFVHIF